MGMILTRTDATFSWPRDQSIRECQDENAGTAEGFPDQCQWREELQAREKENAPCLSHLGTVSHGRRMRTYRWKEDLSFLSARKPVFALLWNQE
jgi:hypothetical protein